MIYIRKSAERGATNIEWLESYHSFSFGEYYDPNHMGFGSLRVINDDIIKGGGGFGEHGHKDMEIVTYMISGTLAHKDSIGNVETIKAGEVQRMSAGKGIRHSEFNASESEAARLLQVWFLPEEAKRQPGYEQKKFSQEDKRNKLKLVVSHDGVDGSLKIGQDVDFYASIVDKGKTISHKVNDRKIWLQVARGELELNGSILKEGDGAAIKDEAELNIKGVSDESEFVLFSMNKNLNTGE